MRELTSILRSAIERGASDIHLKAGAPPILRVNTLLTDAPGPPLSPEEVEGIAREIAGEAQWAEFLRRGDLDIAYIAEGLGRFRANLFRQRGVAGVVMRYVKTEIPDFAGLGLPKILETVSLAERGMAIVSGATGCGKSTTLASMVGFINARVRRHIVTVEDPIEFIHTDDASLINQREVGLDTRTFVSALRFIMRQDPDIIMVGEMRDRESFSAALNAADVGCLVLATLHSPDAAQVVLRVMDFFPAAEREQVRLQLSANLVAVVCQRLIPRADDSGMVPAVEIMLGSPVIRKLIRENRLEKLADAIQEGRDSGMQTFNGSLVELVKSGVVSEETALAHSANPESLRMNLQGIYLDESRKILGTD